MKELHASDAYMRSSINTLGYMNITQKVDGDNEWYNASQHLQARYAVELHATPCNSRSSERAARRPTSKTMTRLSSNSKQARKTASTAGGYDGSKHVERDAAGLIDTLMTGGTVEQAEFEAR